MDLGSTIGILKEATEAVDKAIGIVERLGKLINSAIDRSVEILTWNSARRTRNDLSDLLAESMRLLYTGNIRLVEKLAEDVSDNLLRQETLDSVAYTLISVRHLLEELELKQTDIVSKEFYEPLYSTLSTRQHVLTRILDLKTINGSNEMSALEAFVERYEVLIAQLGSANQLLAKYIEKMEKINGLRANSSFRIYEHTLPRRSLTRRICFSVSEPGLTPSRRYCAD